MEQAPLQKDPIQNTQIVPIILTGTFPGEKITEEEFQSEVDKRAGKDVDVIMLTKYKLDIGVIKLISQIEWKHLYQITIAMSNLGGQGCKLIANTRMIGLKFLNVHNNELESNSIQNLFRANYPLLKVLGLSSNKLTNESLKVLLRARLPELRKLYLANNPITYQGLQMLSLANLPDEQYDPRKANVFIANSLPVQIVDVKGFVLSQSEETKTVRNLSSRYPAADIRLH